jgi:DNA repair exonuclease SbcCD nuclease subunit
MIAFYTDPHIGINRIAGTTPESRRKLSNRIYQQCLDLNAEYDGVPIVCLGDLFDSFSNSELFIEQAIEIIKTQFCILAGNHDLVNRSDAVGSLQLLKTLYPNKVLITEFGGHGAHITAVPDEAILISIPHVATQELFEESLEHAYTQASYKAYKEPRILLLHCNFNLSYDNISETTLNLSSKWAEQLLNVFSYVLLGHEHIHRSLYDDRLVILGNIHPTGFTDIADKYCWTFDNGILSKHLLWSKSSGYAEIDFNQLPITTSAEFIRIVGKAKPEDLLTLSKNINKMWKTNDSVLAIKMDVEVEDTLLKLTSSKEVTLKTLPDMIREELRGTPALYRLWVELSGDLYA